MSKPIKSKNSLQNLAGSLVRKARSNHLWRQKEAFNLIPSEQTLSPLVRLLTIADPSGRYAEHRRMKAFGDAEIYYYQGTRFISEVEVELNKRMKEYLITLFSLLAQVLSQPIFHISPHMFKR